MIDSIKHAEGRPPVYQRPAQEVGAVPESTAISDRRHKVQVRARTVYKERRKQPDRRQHNGESRDNFELRSSRGRRKKDRLHIAL